MGLSVPEVALISGHRDPRMLFRYTHLKAVDVALKLEEIQNSKCNFVLRHSPASLLIVLHHFPIDPYAINELIFTFVFGPP